MVGIIYSPIPVAIGMSSGAGLDFFVFLHFDLYLQLHLVKLVYTVMGLATTVVFWGVQTACVLVWRSETALMIGGALGLAIGYVVKYRLDRRFVFTPEFASGGAAS